MDAQPSNPSNDELVMLYKAREVIKEQVKSKVDSLRGHLFVQKENRAIIKEEEQYRQI
jgi:hypothetical protein